MNIIISTKTPIDVLYTNIFVSAQFVFCGQIIVLCAHYLFSTHDYFSYKMKLFTYIFVVKHEMYIQISKNNNYVNNIF